MSVEIRDFTKFDIAVSPTGVQSGNFGILGFLTNEAVLSPAQRYLAFTGVTEVHAKVGAVSEVGKAATAFYAQTPTPRDFVVMRQFLSATPAEVICLGPDLVALQALSSATLDITVDGTEYNGATIDFSGAADLAGVVTILDALDASFTATLVGDNIAIRSATTGAGSSITFLDGTAAEALGAEQHQGLIAQGGDAETPVEALAACKAAGAKFVGLDIQKTLRDKIAGADGELTLDIATWAEANKVIFGNTTNNLGTLNKAVTTDTASVLKNSALSFSLTTFSKNKNLYPSSAVFGRAASVNFAGTNTTITVNLKQMAGVTAEDLTSSEFAALKSKNASAVVQIGGQIVAYTNGRMASGTWLDAVHGRLWLENRCETDMFNFIYQDPDKVPYDQSGLNSAEATLEGSLIAAVNNGLIGSGYLTDGTYLPLGYRINAIPISQVASSDKSNRLYSGLSFDVVGKGALHEVNGNGNFVE